MDAPKYNDPKRLFEQMGLAKLANSLPSESLSAFEQAVLERETTKANVFIKENKLTPRPMDSEKLEQELKNRAKIERNEYDFVRAHWVAKLPQHEILSFADDSNPKGYMSLGKEVESQIFNRAIKLVELGPIQSLFPQKTFSYCKYLAWVELYCSYSQEDILGKP